MKTLRKIASVFLCVVIFLSLTVAVASALVQRFIGRPEALAARIADDEYVDMLYGKVYESVKYRMALTVLNTDDIICEESSEPGVITKEVLKSNAASVLASSLSVAFGKSESAEQKYEDVELFERIDSYLTSYAKEAGIEYTEGSSEQVYEMITSEVTSNLRVFPDMYTSKLSGKTAALSKYAGIISPAAFALYAIASLSLLLLNLKNKIGAMHSWSLGSYLASFTLLGASAAFLYEDYMSKTVLTGETAGLVLKKIYDAVFRDLLYVSLILTAVFLVIGIVSVVLSIKNTKAANTDKADKEVKKDEENKEEKADLPE